MAMPRGDMAKDNGKMKPKWTPIKIPLGSIQAWEQNPRMSTKAQALRIIESEKKFNHHSRSEPIPPLLRNGNQREIRRSHP